MEIRILENKGNKLNFMVKGTDTAFVNTLRRLVIDEVPTMAIEDIEFKHNDSVLYDEIVALRLGLVPLKTDLKGYNLPDKCTCKGEGCAKCQVQLTLKTKASGTIDTSKIKSKDPKVVPVYEGMPITKLIGDQEFEFIATAQLGKGRDHTKWSPGHVWFVQQPTITVNNNSNKFEEFKDKFPQQVFDSTGKIDKNLIISSPNLVDACDGVCEDVVKIEYSQNDFTVYLESWGQLSPTEIVDRAVLEFLEKLEEFNTLISKV
jgi:DNA-directed RNA polymerase subunit D